MSTTNIKKGAYDLLKLHWKKIALLYVINLAVSSVLGGTQTLSALTSVYNSYSYGYSDMSTLMAATSSAFSSNIFLTIWSLLFSYGLLKYMFMLTEGNDSLEDIVKTFNFKHFISYFLKTFIVGLAVGAVVLLGGIASIILAFAGEAAVFLAMIFIVVGVLYVSMMFFPVTYYAVEMPELNIGETFNLAKASMNGNKGRLLGLLLYFLGLNLVIVILYSIVLGILGALMISSILTGICILIGIFATIVLIVVSVAITYYQQLAYVHFYLEIKQ